MDTYAKLAADPFLETVRAITADRLVAPTPCDDFDVRGLIEHLLVWGPMLVGSATKQAVPPATEVDPDWRGALETQLRRLVDGWSQPAAWQGTTYMGTTDLPATIVGAMALGELVVHGWDLGRAIGQDPCFDEHLLVFLHDELSRMADQGRAMGVYGPEVPVPLEASTMERLLGLTGRDPHWQPPG